MIHQQQKIYEQKKHSRTLANVKIQRKPATTIIATKTKPEKQLTQVKTVTVKTTPDLP